MASLPCSTPLALIIIIAVSTNSVTGFYVQPDVLFLSEHPKSRYVVANSPLTLSCGVQLRGLSATEGGLSPPVVWWSFNNNTRISNVFPSATESKDLSPHHFLRSTLHIPHAYPSHSGTYHCNIEDGTNKGGKDRFPDLCYHNPCLPFITASNPAIVTVLENSTVVEEMVAMVEVERCSSRLLPCGSLLPGPSLRPTLEWVWDGVSLNQTAADSYDVMANGDLALYHSPEGLFQCTVRSDSDFITLATYNVTENVNSSVESLRLVVSPDLPVMENDAFSVHLSSSGVCPGNNDSLSCVWMRNDSHLCSTTTNSTRYTCSGRALTVSSATQLLDRGRYCCLLNGESADSLCIDINIVSQGSPFVASPQNGTTFTNSTLTPSPVTLTCTLSQPHGSSLQWFYNGEMVPEWSGLAEVEVNTSSFGVYQCFAGNEFGYSVIAIRITVDGWTNPPGIPVFEEVPRPDILHRPAYIISWPPPSYPNQLNPSHSYNYSLSTIPSPTLSSEPSVELFITFDTNAFLYVHVVDSGQRLSEESLFLFHKFNHSICYKQVYFPPRLSTDCSGGVLAVSWTNSPDNVRYYNFDYYSINGPYPGLYYINITCHLLNSSIFETGGVYDDEGGAVFNEELPVGSQCVVRGAATPTTGPALCLDPSAILYITGTSCLTTASVQFKNGSQVVSEGEGVKDICLAVQGYNFSLELVATYEDDNTTEVVTEVYVSGASEEEEEVCVSVDLRDDEIVGEERNISLSLHTPNPDIVHTSPSVTLTILDDDELHVVFTSDSYEVVEGGVLPMCVETDSDLRRTVNLVLYEDSISNGEFTPHDLVLNEEVKEVCVRFNTENNDYVDRERVFSIFLESSDSAVNTSSLVTAVTIFNDDVATVTFTEAEYVMDEGKSMELCVETSDDLRVWIELNLTSDKVGNEDLVLPEVFTLGPGALRSCQTARSLDNSAVDYSRTYKMTLETNNSFVALPTSETLLIVTNDDVASVGFAEMTHVMQAGTVHRVCVVAEGVLEKPISVSLSVNELIPGTGGGIVDLDTENLTFLDNERVCVLLNATSSVITENVTLALELSTSDPDVTFHSDTAYITVTPAPGMSEQSSSVLLMIMVWLLPLLVITAVVVGFVLLWCYCFCRNRRSSSTADIIFTEKSLELHTYVKEPRVDVYGSVPTIFEELVLVPADGGEMDEKNSGSVGSILNQMGLQPGELLEKEGEGGEVEEGEVEGGEECEEEDTKPPASESRTTQSSLSHASTHSQCISVASSTLHHHEYITSDSILLCSSYPPSVAGSSGCYHHSGRDNESQQTATTGDTLDSTVPQNDRVGDSDTGNESLGMEHECDQDLDSTVDAATKSFTVDGGMTLLDDADLSAFMMTASFAAADSGISMGVDIGEKL